MKNLLSVVALTGTLAAGAFAQAIPTSLLNSSNDGAGTDVQSMLNAAGTGVNVADQSSFRVFQQTGSSMTFDFLWSQAGLAGKHRLGYYEAGSPGSINWVLGNVNQDGVQVTSWTGSINGIFGMALDNGAGSIFFSESGLNSDTPVAASADPSLVGFDRANHLAVFPGQADATIISWEDLMGVNPVIDGGLLDYNDYGYRLSGAAPVPEPGTMIALGAAAAVAAFRRRRKAVKA